MREPYTIRDTCARKLAVLWCCFGLFIGVGCSSQTTPKKPSATPVNVDKDDADHPIVKEARTEADALLKNLLAGRTGNDTALARIASKVERYSSWSYDRQELQAEAEPRMVRLSGMLSGGRPDAAFSMTMVKQKNGRWAIGTFQGPTRLGE